MPGAALVRAGPRERVPDPGTECLASARGQRPENRAT